MNQFQVPSFLQTASKLNSGYDLEHTQHLTWNLKFKASWWRWLAVQCNQNLRYSKTISNVLLHILQTLCRICSIATRLAGSIMGSTHLVHCLPISSMFSKRIFSPWPQLSMPN